ncbi:MAG: hypothetical protein IT368_11525, partial [Candidatus Hydrogenedentes bacterium]|nr:hypothetical protein [Candidatus Hydrogenedentota bacterium]
MNGKLRFWQRACVLGFALIVPAMLLAEEPTLPPGLAGPSESSSEPALPPGLGAPAAEPALPQGLGAPSDQSDQSDQSDEATPSLQDRLPFPIHGFWETRGALRLQGDPVHSKDYTLGETRLQLESQKIWKRASLDWKSDVFLDGVREQADFDLREARLTLSL